MSYKLFLDDERLPSQVGDEVPGLVSFNNDDWVIVKDFWEFKAALRERGLPTHVSFDYFLGDKYTGADCAEVFAMYLDRNDDVDLPFPVITIHTRAPEGAKKIRETLAMFT